MVMLINGKWEQSPVETRDKTGHYVRKDSTFREWIKADGSSDFQPEANRYHLYVSYACPWACRALIFRRLKGLEDVISYSSVAPLMEDKGWKFGSVNSGREDQINGKSYLHEIYSLADPSCTTKVTVPVLWDKQTHKIVNNESSEIIRMLNSEFNTFAKYEVDFYPVELRSEIDRINELVYHSINNGVYKCGFAGSQEAYEEAFNELFSALDELELLLSKQRYLVGDQLTEADWRLFTTLIRFDVVYVGHFKCNLRRIDDYPNLSNYLRELYQVPGVKETVNFPYIKQHYYQSHTSINPTGIVPKGPIVDFEREHNREGVFE